MYIQNRALYCLLLWNEAVRILIFPDAILVVGPNPTLSGSRLSPRFLNNQYKHSLVSNLWSFRQFPFSNALWARLYLSCSAVSLVHRWRHATFLFSWFLSCLESNEKPTSVWWERFFIFISSFDICGLLFVTISVCVWVCVFVCVCVYVCVCFSKNGFVLREYYDFKLYDSF